jgi:hypothetical protein
MSNEKLIVESAINGDYVKTEKLFSEQMSRIVASFLKEEKQKAKENFFTEATMTPKQKEHAEIIVHGMKKNEDELKKNYGSDWESVMHAVANKKAKEQK